MAHKILIASKILMSQVFGHMRNIDNVSKFFGRTCDFIPPQNLNQHYSKHTALVSSRTATELIGIRGVIMDEKGNKSHMSIRRSTPALPYFDSSAAVPDTPKKPYFESDSHTFFCRLPPPCPTFLPPPPFAIDEMMIRMQIERNYWIIRRFLFHLNFPLFIKFSNDDLVRLNSAI